MGNRESLLAGAKQCLFEKGYTRTTSRDIAKAAGTSLAAIGYHFGSTQELLNQALFEAVGEWSEELGKAFAGEDGTFTEIWDRIIESLPTHRPLWATQFELVGQIDRVPELQEFLSQSQRYGRPELAKLFHGDKAFGESDAALVGTFYQALLAGVMVQWLVDPQHAPTGADLAKALQLITRPA